MALRATTALRTVMTATPMAELAAAAFSGSFSADWAKATGAPKRTTKAARAARRTTLRLEEVMAAEEMGVKVG